MPACLSKWEGVVNSKPRAEPGGIKGAYSPGVNGADGGVPPRTPVSDTHAFQRGSGA